MSDLDPLIHLEAQDDPTLTRVLERHGLPPNARALVSAVRTSCSVVVTDTTDATRPLIDALSRWKPDNIRVEALVIESEERALVGAAQFNGSGVSWRSATAPLGGRACVLAEAVEQIENEFVIVPTGVAMSFEEVPALLTHMWREGADVGVLERPSIRLPGESRFSDGDAAEQLSEWLGLQNESWTPRLVLVRRWVARWLFSEISRSINPADELADRARLLGVTMVRSFEGSSSGL